MALQYRRSATGGGGKSAAVDWELFEETLARVDPCFSDPRFDSLKHVLTVLSSSNAEQEVAELQEQRAAIEEMVDAVVEGYHAGFNKSIHNYSLILRLFTESRLQLESLRRSLEAAKRRLSAQSRHMVSQYQRDLQLSDTLRLLDDIQGCTEVPARVQRLEESKEWPMAVSVLLDGCNKLAREELQAVGALRELAEEMGRRRAGLQASLVAELEARVYRLDGGAAAAGGLAGSLAGSSSSAAGGGEGISEGGGRPPVPRLLLSSPSFQRRSSSNDSEYSSAAGNLSARGGLPPRPPGGPAALARVGSWGREGGLAAAASAGGDALGSLASLPRRPVHRRAQTLGGLMPAGTGLTAVDGHLVDTELPLTALVDCVAQLGGLHEAQAALRRRMPCQLAAVISRALDSFPASQRLPPGQYAQEQQRSAGAAGAAGPGDDISVPPPVAGAAQALLEHVLSACLQVFQQATRLLHMLSLARVPKASSGLELLLRQAAAQQRHQQQLAGGDAAGAAGAAQPPAGPPSAEVTRAEVAAAWECLQVECQRLLADILGVAPPQRAQRGEEQGDVPLAGWLASVSGQLDAPAAAAAAAAAADSGMLTFSLEHEVEGLLATPDAAAGEGDGGSLDAAAAAAAAADARERIRGIMGGHPGGPALVAALYRPVLQFSEAAERHVSGLVGAGSSEPTGRMAALLAMPWRNEPAAAERSLLRGYVESFLRMEFLPAVYVSARARCSAALEDGDAFKPRSRLRAPYQLGAGAEGRPVLPAALAAERMVEELLGWAAQVPPFATHLTGKGMELWWVRLCMCWWRKYECAVCMASLWLPSPCPGVLINTSSPLFVPLLPSPPGVVENVLGRVVDAFEARMVSVLGGSAAGRLAASLPMVQLMVKEPAAALLGSPVAFFVGRNTEAMESFMSSVIAAGFGANDESVESEILQRLMAERPLAAASLLAAGGDVGRLASLAALSDSLDYVADVIHRCTGSGGGSQPAGSGGTSPAGALGRRPERRSSESSGGGSGAATPLAVEASQQPGAAVGGSGGSASGATWQQQLGSRFKAWRRSPAGEGGLSEGLAHLADRYRALAGQCARALRLDLLLLVLHHLQQLPRSSYVCQSEEEAREVDECVATLARLVGRLDDGLEPYLPPHKRAYAFSSLAPAAARMAVWLLPDIPALNHLGVQRMCRMLASLQPALSGVGTTGTGSFRPEAARAFDRAKLYYTLLTYSAEGLVATVAEKPHRFSGPEYLALLAANVVERPVTAEHRQQLQRVLTEAGRLAKPGKANAALQGALAKAVKTFQRD